ncbi:fumarylacetoacetate hydrolase family protein [Yoonia sp. SS1-5]|uniref:Fumarylacetoacetate hydrolase family protein n=1 Tax=Yoonia rhodophyticola TaxID=3137370 RepID=A0AAN0NGY6_9RHOB
MKLLRYGPIGQEKPGMIDGQGGIRDLSAHVPDIAGDALSSDGLAKLAGIDPDSLPQIDPATRIGACVGGIGKVICIGLNYSDHAAESGMEVPPEPVIFSKATSAVCGPNDNIEIPRSSKATDWEVELAIVIGTHAKYVSEEDALDYVAGYAIMNDVSERDFQQKRSGQWTKGKSCDTFGPLGPWLVTKDEITDPQDLAMKLSVNGHSYQDGSTNTMVYKVPFLISYLSQFMSLHPGDVISTGTPPGVGQGQKPPVFLRPGDVVELSVDGLGQQRQSVVAG